MCLVSMRARARTWVGAHATKRFSNLPGKAHPFRNVRSSRRHVPTCNTPNSTYISSPSSSSLVFGSGVSVPNKPSASPLTPAVKNK